MRPWQAQNNAGDPVPLIYYGAMWWPSQCQWIIPGHAEEYTVMHDATVRALQRPYAPLHIIQGRAGPWRRWFAWRPVRTQQGTWVWLRHTWRRRFCPPAWFCPPAPHNGWLEYSDKRMNFWDWRGEPANRCPECDGYDCRTECLYPATGGTYG